MYAVKRIDSVGWAKVYTVASLIVVFIMMLPAVVIATLAGALSDDVAGLAAGPVVLAAVIAFLVGLGILIFIASWLQAVIFNLALSRTGGLKIELDAAN